MDREKVIKEYEGYVNSYISLTTSDDYEFEMHKAVLALLKDQQNVISGLKVINDGLCEAVKEQKQIVRCKDCKHWYFADNRIPCEQENVCGRNGIVVTPDWYCADGERNDSKI